MAQIQLPARGRSKGEILADLKALKKDDADWHDGQMFGLIYDAGREVEELAIEAASTFMIENALSPMAFPSLLKMETEVVSMVLSLMNGGDEAVGSMTSGGTESILMAVKAARDWAREVKPGIEAPEMIAPITAHPAWNKAAHYLGLKIISTPVRDDLKADVQAMKEAITDDTILLGGTAVTYPHGVVDPIDEISKLALEKDLWVHVDACLGGLMLPFLKKLGYEIPPYDFSLSGVKSISADIHKYAYTPKGISTVLYPSKELRKYQFFSYADWPGGIYATPCVAGGRPGGTLASAWAVMRYLGEEGFLKLAGEAKQAADRIMAGVNAIPELYVMGEPEATVFAIASDQVNVFELGARMNALGWHIDSQHLPPSLHMTVSPVHAGVTERFLKDLARTAGEVSRVGPDDLSEEAALYAMIGTMPDRKMAGEFAVQYLNDLYRVK